MTIIKKNIKDLPAWSILKVGERKFILNEVIGDYWSWRVIGHRKEVYFWWTVCKEEGSKYYELIKEEKMPDNVKSNEKEVKKKINKKQILIYSLLIIIPLIAVWLVYLDKRIAKNSGEYVVCSVDSAEEVIEEETDYIELDKSWELKFLEYTD